MNSGQSTPNLSFPPHKTHAEPWAHNYICCDADHNASTSRPSTPVSRFSASASASAHHRSHPSTSTVHSFDVPASACCDEPHCPDTADVVECCTDPACQEGAICEDEGCHFPHNPNALPGDPDSAESMRELERWACSQEGCHAIQQYAQLECCTQDDCALPVCTDPHPAPLVCHHDQQDTQSGLFGTSVANHQQPNFQPNTQQQTSMFDPSQLPPAPWPQPLAASSSISSGNAMAANVGQAQVNQAANTQLQPVVPNVCHWQNCHQVFGTTPELLAHIAADHLNASSATVPPPSGGSSQQTATAPMDNMATMLDPSAFNTQPFDLSSLQLNNNGVDPLMSCLWDDCFPSNPDPSTNLFNSSAQSMPTGQAFDPTAATSNAGNVSMPAANEAQIPGHGHAHGHPHGQSSVHGHTHPNGEPFSPQTMLRHVLEEHLGLNPGDLSWTAPLGPPPVPTSTPILPSISSAATTPVITPIHPVKPHHHHIPLLPTPSPSTYTSSPPPPPKALICLWPGCTACNPFPDTASLMAHLSDEHIGKCKNSYLCLWDSCGHCGGREFKSRQKVLRHLQSHIGHKPYVCEVCDQAFSEAAPLAAHKRRHAQEKPFQCDHPGCGKTFAISSSLTIHMRTHNGEKPFVCPHCDKGFVEASNLTKHIRTHTGERPFMCSYPGCEKRFPRPDQLKRHMAIHDANRPGRGKKSRTGSIADLTAVA